MTQASHIKLQNTIDRIAGAILSGTNLNPLLLGTSNGPVLSVTGQYKLIKKQLNVTLVTNGVTLIVMAV